MEVAILFVSFAHTLKKPNQDFIYLSSKLSRIQLFSELDEKI